MMLSNENIYSLVKAIIRKESRGGVFTPDDFNLRFPVLVRERYDYKKGEMERTSDITEDMEHYLASSTPVYNSGGTYTKPTNFEKHLGAMTVYGGVYRPLDLITRMEYTQLNSLTQPTLRNPVMYYENGVYHVKPPTSQGVQIHYMVSPVEPFLDYYYDSNRNIVFLEVDYKVEIVAPAEYRDGTTGTKISTTVECDLADSDKVAVMYMLLKQYGVSLPDEMLLQYGMNEQLKSER
jgi:hypothetical protein